MGAETTYSCLLPLSLRYTGPVSSELKTQVIVTVASGVYMLMLGQLTGFPFPSGLLLGLALGWVLSKLYIKSRKEKEEE